MNVVKLYTRMNIVSIAFFLGLFVFFTYQEGAPAWRMLIVLVISQVGFFFSIRMIKKRVEEMEKEKDNGGASSDQNGTQDRF